MPREFYVETESSGVCYCPGCGALLGRMQDVHMTLRHDCGAMTEWCVSHEHPEGEAGDQFNRERQP